MINLNLTHPLTPNMLAVLVIMSSDFYLKECTKPFIDLKTQEIQWDQVFKLRLNSPHKIAVAWAYALWSKEIYPGTHPFDGLSALDPELKRSILKALTLSWA